jgi:hypothetical protein
MLGKYTLTISHSNPAYTASWQPRVKSRPIMGGVTLEGWAEMSTLSCIRGKVESLWWLFYLARVQLAWQELRALGRQNAGVKPERWRAWQRGINKGWDRYRSQNGTVRRPARTVLTQSPFKVSSWLHYHNCLAAGEPRLVEVRAILPLHPQMVTKGRL